MSLVIEPAVGEINDVNKSFSTSFPIGLAFQVEHNGRMRREIDADGWLLTGASSFDMKVAPRVGDRLMVVYTKAV